MMTRYSAATGVFYPLDIDYGDALPADVIEVSHVDYETAMNRPAGATFTFVDGELVISPPPEPNPNDEVLARIDAIERSTMVPRVMREFLLLSAQDMAQRQAAATGQAVDQILAANIGYQKTKAVDDQIRALREMLK